MSADILSELPGLLGLCFLAGARDGVHELALQLIDVGPHTRAEALRQRQLYT